MHGCNATVEWAPVPYPPTVNDAAAFEFVRTVAGQLATAAAAAAAAPGGKAGAGDAGSKAAASLPMFIELPEPSMAAEDFSYYSREVRHVS